MTGQLLTGPVQRTTATVIADLAPVALAELVDQAALLTRVDRKYLVPQQTAIDLLSCIDERTRVLEIAGRRGFAYDSVYFDTADHLSFRLTAQRRRRRFKLRTRSYVDAGSAFLELKTKNGRGSTVKQRMPYLPGDRAHLTEEGRGYLGGLLEAEGHASDLVAELRPALVSQYRRTTLLLPDGSRATVDTELRWSRVLGGGAELTLALPEQVILESKSAGPPSALDRALWRSGHRPTGISKFGTGTAALYPELPRNKWARILSGPFSAASVTSTPTPTPTPTPTRTVTPAPAPAESIVATAPGAPANR